MDDIILDKEIKIRNATAVWSQIRESEDPPEIDCSELEKVDGAGFQLLSYLAEQNYKLKALSEEMTETLISKGFVFKGETEE